jgi:hypothetical protein
MKARRTRLADTVQQLLDHKDVSDKACSISARSRDPS